MHRPRSRLIARSVLSLTLWMAFSATFFLAQAQGPVIRVESKTVAPGEVTVINITVSSSRKPERGSILVMTQILAARSPGRLSERRLPRG